MSSSSSETPETPAVDETAADATVTEEELQALQESSPRPQDEGVEEYDINRPRVLRGNQQEGLETAFEAATKLLTPVLKHELRTEVIVEFRGGEAVYFDRYLTQMPVPINVFPVSYRSMEFQGAISLDSEMAFWFVNSLLGGEAEDDSKRSLTDTESAVATKIVELILDEIHTSLAPALQVDASVDGFVASRTQAHVIKPPSIAFACTFAVQWESTQAEFVYLLPLKLLKPIVQMLAPKTDQQREKRLEALFGTLGQAFMSVSLEVAAVLGRPQLSLNEISNLAVDDVIPIGAGLDAPIEVTIQGDPKLQGAFGLQGSNYAVVIQKWLRE